MSILIEFIEDGVLGRISASEDVPLAMWARIKAAVLQFNADAQFRGRTVIVDWRTVTAAAREFSSLQRRLGAVFEYDTAAKRQLLRFREEARAVATLRDQMHLPKDVANLPELLRERGFTKRDLTSEQLRDAKRMLQMPHGANFSVPGAGKTTVALAVHLACASPPPALLVVAPKNAFGAWDEVLTDCMNVVEPPFVRLSGSPDAIAKSLFEAGDGARLIISYDQLRTSTRQVAAFLLQHATHMILDESHRIKSGQGSQRGQAALSIAQLAVRRDILSGTPVPNGIEDLGPQLEFLWPSQGLGRRLERAARPRDVLAPYYVRTTKQELGLGPIKKYYWPVDMSPAQVALYSLVRDELLKVEAGVRANPATVDLDNARRSVMSLLQIASSPVMFANRYTGGTPDGISDDNGTIEAIFAGIYEEGDSPKIRLACQMAREAALHGQRTVIWTTFTYNVERIATLLADVGATFIHGKVDTGSANDPDTREGRIRQFHATDGKHMVLVANPAACSEGISLHRACHQAIYVDRSFNAGHFLQSIDRIHRLGLAPGIETRVHILESVAPQQFGSIDYSVRRRMVAKLRDMYAVLEDPDLQTLLLDEDSADAPLDFDIQREDIIDVLDQLRGLAPDPGEEDL